MKYSFILGALAYAGLASAETHTSVSTKTTSGKCSTAYGSGDGVRPTPVPTSVVTEAVSSFTTHSTVSVPKGYTRVTDKTVTVTEHTLHTGSVVFASVTSGIQTKWSIPTVTVATATWPVTTCTNNIKQKTVTKYTGTYTPVPGQATTVPATFATQAVCTNLVTSIIHLLPTVTGSTIVTIHDTPTSTINDFTTTVSSDVTYLTVTTPSATVTSTTTTYTARGLVVPTRVACEETVTRTMDARCAPTNLIGDYNGIGLVAGRYNANVSVVYTREEPYVSNPSECCQSCLDNEGCGASMWGPGETCGLYYHSDASGQPQCDFIFTYGAQANRYAAGQGIIVANGCGTVQYE
ncbi:hypothetical protein F4808DRAFT_416580 [Astrocystis sublimbata]|nr:hypothetical protein F4808DRAFT_416580 [Astrocystis sublimbata]